MPSGYKALYTRSDEDVILIVKEDFEASEYDRDKKDEENFQAYRTFHCRDLISRKDITGRTDDVIGGGMPRLELESIAVNKTFLPWLRGIALTSVARISRGLWPDFNDFYRIDPDDKDDEGAARAAYGLTQYFIRSSRYKQESMLVLLAAHLFDFGILYTGWRTDFGAMPKPVDMQVEIKDFMTGEYQATGEIDPARREIEWVPVEDDGWDVASINPFNFRYDPMAGHEGFGEFCGVTALISKRRGWQLVEAGEWDKAAMNEIDPDEPPNESGHDDSAMDMDRRIREDEKLQGFDMREYLAKRYVRADMYWTPDSKAVVLNKRVVAQKARSWRIPFHKTVFIQKQGMFGGDSMVKPLMPAQVDMNQCLRLLRTQQDRAINLDSVIDPSFFASFEEAEAMPWGTGATIVATRNPLLRDPALARRFIFHPSNTAPDLWNSITLQQQLGERAVGISQQSQGDVGEGGATATAVRDATAGVNIRSAFLEVGIEESLVISPIDDLIKLIALNVTQKRMVRIRGAEGMDWQMINPAEMIFKKSPDVIALGMSSMASRQVAAQAVRDVTLVLSKDPVFQQHLKALPSMRELYRMLDVDPDIFVNDQNMAQAEVAVPPEWIPELLARGKRVPLNAWDDHMAVITALMAFIQSPEFGPVPEANKQLILEHIKLRKAAMSQAQAGGVGAPSLPNEAGGGGGMVAGPQPMVQGGQPQGAPAVAPAAGAQPMPATPDKMRPARAA